MNFICEDFSLLFGPFFKQLDFLFLCLQLGLEGSNLFAEILGFTLLLVFDQLELVVAGLELPLELLVVFFELRELGLELLYFTLKVIHVDLHLVLKLYESVI